MVKSFCFQSCIQACFLFCVSVAAVGQTSPKLPTGANAYPVAQIFAAPAPDTDPIVSFDWDGMDNLYFTTGDGNFGPRMNAYKVDGETITPIIPELAKFAGARLTNVQGFIFFSENGDFGTFTDLDVYRYDPLGSSDAINVGRGGVESIYGIATRTGTEIFASAGFPSSIYYTGVDTNGDFTETNWIKIADIGDASGPVAFDPWGNMYYVPGFATEPKIYRFSAAEVDAAIAAKGALVLSGAGHEWADIDGYPGATGAACDAAGNLIISATSFGVPSSLRSYQLACDGSNAGFIELATDPDRFETVRFMDGRVFFSSGQGVFDIDMPPSVVRATPLGMPAADAASVEFEIVFTEAVSGVEPDLSDFEPITDGYAGGRSAPSLEPGSLSVVDEQTYRVRVTTGVYRGGLGLRVLATGDIMDAGSAALVTPYDGCPSVMIATADVEDINADGETNSMDIQVVINSVLGIGDSSIPSDVTGDMVVNASDIQTIINKVLAG